MTSQVTGLQPQRHHRSRAAPQDTSSGCPGRAPRHNAACPAAQGGPGTQEGGVSGGAGSPAAPPCPAPRPRPGRAP
ncbi:hypothetical protein DFI_03445 [Deinococcus ficus]|uniref:Uncharacterized protein n=1 Tax=Deinococcus ficus TaxID=317577 RepID=A0A221SU62_9DEIO|nr:hypothetical protein DFI_03445 [Deinococcus ficus]